MSFTDIETGRRAVVLVVVAVLLLSAGTGVVAAGPIQSGFGTVVVEEGETSDGIEGVAGSIVVRGTVSGDVAGVAGTVHVAEGGTVDGAVEVAAGSVRVDGTVTGDVSAGAGHVEVGETARIGGDLAVGAGYLSVDGAVDGDVRAGAETIVLGPNADVAGEFRYDAGEFTEDPAASVGGGVVHDASLGGNGVGTVEVFTVPPWLVTGYELVASLLLGAVLLAVFPSFSSGVASRVADDPVTSGGVGVLTLIGVPVALVLVALTVVGIPLTVLGAFGFALAVWVAVVYGQYAVGAWALGLADRENRWLALAVGLVGFAVLGAVPFLGGLLEFVAFLLGLGALALGLRDAFRERRGRTSSGRQATLDEVPGDVAAGGPGEGS
ncbi:bactofilin family protein [Salinilacihabitans rarus]|uniref:bactofilin family protein n=1 Tax=Salinilacihabitans rarus TaxID=2961596 RepID=UPI0020C8FADF|nr:polymer-forming cytoskeletal protein [Salinilacihabitans rarus]